MPSSLHAPRTGSCVRITFAIVMTSWLPAIAWAQEPTVGAADADAYRSHRHTLYIDGNITGGTGNAILSYDIGPDGSLRALPGSPFLTGGNGFYDASFKLGPFDVDQEMALNDERNILYAVNAGSNTISALQIGKDGGLYPLPGQPFESHGSTPVSLGLRDENLVSVDSAQDPAQAGHGYLPGLTVSRIRPSGRLHYLTDSAVALPADAQPSQALTTNTAPFVFTAEFPGGGSLRAFYQSPDGHLYQTDKVALPLEGRVQPLPLGLWAHPSQPYLYVGFVNTNQLGVYRWTAQGKLEFVRAAANSGQALCWIRVSRDGRRLYTANTGDASMSVYDLSQPDRPVEIQHLAVDGLGGVEQFSLTPDGHLLYLLQQENSVPSAGKSNRVRVLRVDAETGLLTLLDKLTVSLPLPARTRPFGIAIR